MKYELIKKILNSPITILDYLILEHVVNDTLSEFLKDNILNLSILELKINNYISDNNKLTLKGKQLMDSFKISDKEDFYERLHTKLQEKLIELTGKKQKMLQSKYSFLPNSKDLKLRLQKLIKKYDLQDFERIEKVLLSYIEKCYKTRFEYVQTIEYYLMKNDVSKFVTDYENFIETENDSTEFEGINI